MREAQRVAESLSHVILDQRRRCIAFLWIFVCLVFVRWGDVRSCDAALLVLPPGEKSALLWERALVVYDQLSLQQTVIAEVAVKGSPRHFAILTTTPSVASIDYTTTRIWRYVNRHLQPKKLTSHRLDIQFESLLWDRWRRGATQRQAPQFKTDVIRSYNTQIHIQERALHEWLVNRGLSLRPEQALSVKQAYQSGASIVALWVRSTREGGEDVAQVSETWTSTWIFTHEVSAPYYPALFPQSLESRFGEKRALQGREEDETNLTVSFLTDKPLVRLTSGHTLHEPPIHAELTRREVSSLNDTLGVHQWSYKRRGILSVFDFSPLEGMHTIEAVSEANAILNRPQTITEAKAHVLKIPIELLLFLFVLGFFAWRAKRSRW